MKLCKDCKHFGAPAYVSGQFVATCLHAQAPIDPVFGRKNGMCVSMRQGDIFSPNCGPDGDWFEVAPVAVEPMPVPVNECPGDTPEVGGFLASIVGSVFR